MPDSLSGVGQALSVISLRIRTAWPISCYNYVGWRERDITLPNQSAHRWARWVAVAHFNLSQRYSEKNCQLGSEKGSGNTLKQRETGGHTRKKKSAKDKTSWKGER